MIDLVWSVNGDDGCNYELPHTMSECESFQNLLNMLEEEVDACVPSAAGLLRRTNLWRLSYSLPDGTPKVFIARKGTEVAFVRLRTAIARSWTDSVTSLEVGLKAIA